MIIIINLGNFLLTSDCWWRRHSRELNRLFEANLRSSKLIEFDELDRGWGFEIYSINSIAGWDFDYLINSPVGI